MGNKLLTTERESNTGNRRFATDLQLPGEPEYRSCYTEVGSGQRTCLRKPLTYWEFAFWQDVRRAKEHSSPSSKRPVWYTQDKTMWSKLGWYMMPNDNFWEAKDVEDADLIAIRDKMSSVVIGNGMCECCQ